MAHKAIAVANEFLSLAEKHRIENSSPYWFINALELHKLVVIAHGAHYHFENTELVSDPLIVGEFEPTFRALVDSLSFYGDDPVTRKIPVDGSAYDAFFANSADYAKANFSENEISSIEATWKLFSEFGLTCSQLSYFTRGKFENWEEERTKLSGDLGNIYPIHLLAIRLEKLFTPNEDKNAA